MSDPGAWTYVVAPVGALLGVGLGAVFEPLRNRFARRSQRRAELRNLVADVIGAATDARYRQVGLNQLYRREKAGTTTVDKAKADGLVAEYQQTRNDLRRAVALLALHDEPELVAQARIVQQREDELTRLPMPPVSMTRVIPKVASVPRHRAQGSPDWSPLACRASLATRESSDPTQRVSVVGVSVVTRSSGWACCR